MNTTEGNILGKSISTFNKQDFMDVDVLIKVSSSQVDMEVEIEKNKQMMDLHFGIVHPYITMGQMY